MWDVGGSRRARVGCLRLQGHGVRPCPGIGERGQGGASADDYAIASGSDLPFEDARFDLVVAYNVLMDVEDVSATLKEIKRVLRPAGMLVISIVHLFSDRGRFAS